LAVNRDLCALIFVSIAHELKRIPDQTLKFCQYEKVKVGDQTHCEYICTEYYI